MIKGYGFILLAAILWGFIGIFSSLAFQEGLSPMEVAFWRALLGWFCFGTQAVIRKETRIESKDLPLLAIFAVFGISLFYVSYLYAVQTGGVAFAAVLLYTAPAWVVFFSVIIYHEKLTAVKGIAVVLVMAGVYLISQKGSSSGIGISMLALLAGLASGLCYSLYYTVGKYFSGKYSSANIFLYVLPMGALGVFPFVEFVDKTPLAWAGLVGVAIVSTFMANYCYYNGLKYLEAGRASIVATLEPVVAALMAYLIFDEYFAPIGYLGVMLILGAVIATVTEKSKVKS